MNPTVIDVDVEIALRHFDDRLSRFAPDDPRVVSWNSVRSQRDRFDVLVQVADLNGCSLLDVGCGVGDLLAYVRERGIRLEAYHGIDINPRMVAAARTRHPDATFERRDLLADPIEDGAFDYVVESGIFNLATPSWHDVTFGMLEAMWRACGRGIAVNFLSALSGTAAPASYYADPAEIVQFIGERLSTRFVVRHEYRKNDFTVFAYR